MRRGLVSGAAFVAVCAGYFGFQAFSMSAGSDCAPGAPCAAGRGAQAKVVPLVRPGQPIDPAFVQAARFEAAADGPPPMALLLSDLTPEQAKLWNLGNPISTEPNPAAKPFVLKIRNVDGARALDCLTAAVYYEAGYETAEGQRAVAQVVLNRVRHPAYPKTICGVVFQGSERASGCQFTFTCDGSLARAPTQVAWSRARKIAEAALSGHVAKNVGHATHYHADYVAPYWSPSLVKVAVIGTHIFYRWTGGAGLPPAFGGQYAGNEPLAYPASYTEESEAAPPAEEIIEVAALDLGQLASATEDAGSASDPGASEAAGPPPPTPEELARAAAEIEALEVQRRQERLAPPPRPRVAASAGKLF